MNQQRRKHSRSNSFIYLLERTLRQARGTLQELFHKRNAGMSVDQWIVLSEIERAPGLNQRTLAKRTAKDPASVTRILHLLEKEKLVKRMAHASDLRQVQLKITRSGKAGLTRCEKCVTEFREIAGKGITGSDLNNQAEILDRMFGNCGGTFID